MPRKELYHHYQLEIETLSPVSIGCKSQLTSRGEYFLTGNKTHFIDQDGISEILYQNLTEEDKKEYLATVLNQGVDFNFTDFFKNKGISLEQIPISRSLSFIGDATLVNKNRLLKLHIKSGADENQNNSAYFPGSSLKGMIRTAMVYVHLKSHPELVSKFADKINNWSQIDKYELSKEWKVLEDSIIGKEANQLRIADTQNISDTDMAVYQVRREPLYFTESDSELDWLEECVDKGHKIFGALTYVQKNTKELACINFVPNILLGLNEWMTDMLDFEILEIEKSNMPKKEIVLAQLKSLIESSLQNNEYAAIARLGSGKTFMFNTILLLLEKGLRERILMTVLKTDSIKTRILCSHEKAPLKGWIKLNLRKL
ncbi:type III-A CRISPR-associated RAMP protein Csm5 [Arcticibacterium luteifluviistationis]|nr:type III-A CRISPR-associated RAMP protein Csm5 [Arcticibacterium luteifluviistationis]